MLVQVKNPRTPAVLKKSLDKHSREMYELIQRVLDEILTEEGDILKENLNDETIRELIDVIEAAEADGIPAWKKGR